MRNGITSRSWNRISPLLNAVARRDRESSPEDGAQERIRAFRVVFAEPVACDTGGFLTAACREAILFPEDRYFS